MNIIACATCPIGRAILFVGVGCVLGIAYVAYRMIQDEDNNV